VQFNSPTSVLLGTGNPRKLAEFIELLASAPWEPRTFDQLATRPAEVEEHAATAAENAELKAITYARDTGFWVLADDTELRVAALGGRPGVHTARFAGPTATMTENRAQLLAELQPCSGAQRRAEFHCHLRLADPGGTIRAVAHGVCEGEILQTPHGATGFGYDNLFWIAPLRKTLAEVTPAERPDWTHRGRAVTRLLATPVS
jgi:XTP/dITP diphosphohydrolase